MSAIDFTGVCFLGKRHFTGPKREEFWLTLKCLKINVDKNLRPSKLYYQQRFNNKMIDYKSN